MAVALLALGAPHAARAQQPYPSVPGIAQPLPGAAPVARGDIVDLNTAPPIAVPAIVRLVDLGVYPLVDGTEARPNEHVSESSAAFMMVNLLAPGATGEFPASPDISVSYLDVLSNGALAGDPDQTLDGATFFRLLFVLVPFTPEQQTALRSALADAYPAFKAGNFDTPLTRAGLALLLSETVDALLAPGT